MSTSLDSGPLWPAPSVGLGFPGETPFYLRRFFLQEQSPVREQSVVCGRPAAPGWLKWPDGWNMLLHLGESEKEES